MFARALKWAGICGAVGFAIGFFGPIVLRPDANQGPLLGIFITGPGGAALGFILGLLPLKERTRRMIFGPLVVLGFGALIYYSGPDPLYLGQVLDGEVAACEEPAALLPAAIVRWEEAIQRSTGKPRQGWKEDAPDALTRDPGVVVTIRAPRWTSLLEGRRFWNLGKRWSIGWRETETTKRAYARQWASCAGLPIGTRGQFLFRSLQWGDWPPKHAPGLLHLDLLEAIPDAYRPVLPSLVFAGTMRTGIAVLVAIVALPTLAYSQYMTPGERKMLREAQLRAAEERGEIVAGMTKDSVIRVLGQPDTVNASESGGVRAEQWVYRRKEPNCTGTFDGRNIYVHLRADIVTSTSTDRRCSKPAG